MDADSGEIDVHEFTAWWTKDAQRRAMIAARVASTRKSFANHASSKAAAENKRKAGRGRSAAST